MSLMYVLDISNSIVIQDYFITSVVIKLDYINLMCVHMRAYNILDYINL